MMDKKKIIILGLWLNLKSVFFLISFFYYFKAI